MTAGRANSVSFRNRPDAPRQVFAPWRWRQSTLDRRMAFLQPQPPRQPFFRAPAIGMWLIWTLGGLLAAPYLASDARSREVLMEYALVPARYSRAFLESHMADPGTVWERA